MQKIFTILANLQRTLEQINGNKPLNAEIAPLMKKMDMSAQLFVNPALLPQELEIENVATQEQLEAYSQGVLQAVWNIVTFGQTIKSALYHQSDIRKSFEFLDKEYWIPKIVDKKTYQIGKALQTFLEQILDETTLAELPGSYNFLVRTIEIREPIRTLFLSMKRALDVRLEVYELHTPEKIEETIKYLTETHTRRNQWLTHATKVDTLIKNMDTLSLGLWEIINKQTEPDALEEEATNLQEGILKLEMMASELTPEIKEFELFNSQWNEENQSLPASVISSPFIEAIMSNDESIIRNEWRQLFNQLKAPYPVNVAISLEKDFSAGEKLVNNSNFLLNTTIPEQKNLLENYLKECDLLKINLSQLELEAEKIVEVPELPAIIIGEYPDFSLSIALSSEEPEVNLEICSAAFEELTYSVQQLEKQKIKLQSQYEQLSPPLSYQNPKLYKLYYKAYTTIQNKLISKIDEINNNITLINTFIDETQEHQRHYRYEVHKKNRGTAISQAEARVERSCFSLHSMKPKYELQNNQYRQFIQIYQNNVKFIQNRYEQPLKQSSEKIAQQGLEILLNEIDVTNISTAYKQRVLFLTEARFELTNYFECLKQNQGLYVPINQIPQKELINYLEASPAIKSTVEEIYLNASNSGNYFGFNTTNFSNILWHKLNMFGPSSLDFDLHEIWSLIQSKIKQINEELLVTLDGIDERSPAISPRDGDLWELQKLYHQKNESKKNSHFRLAQLKKENERIIEEKQRHLNFENTKKETKDKNFYSDTLAYLNSEISAEQAQLALHSLETEYLMDDLTLSFQRLLGELRYLSLVPQNELLDEISTQKEKIQQFFKENSQASQLYSQFETMQEKITNIKKKWEEINAIPAIRQPLPELQNLAHELKLLEQKREQMAAIFHRITDQVEYIIKSIEHYEEIAAHLHTEANEPLNAPPPIGVKDQLTNLHNEYFGNFHTDQNLGGIFGHYLEERAQKYWFSDYLSSAVAFLFGVFGYETAATQRKNYLTNLEEDFNTYQTTPTKDNLFNLVRTINFGNARFSPRCKEDEAEYEQSLRAKLNGLKTKIVEVQKAQNNIESPDSIQSCDL